MKRKVIYIAFFGLFLLTTAINGQNKSSNMNNEIEIGIEILKQNFNNKVDTYINIMSSEDTITLQDYINMVRVYNTLEMRNLVSQQKTYMEFMKLFTTKYLELAAKKLESTLTKGMCYYSQKYNLYIGGKPHENSMYKIHE